jgi:hypothetical protein
MLQKNYNRGEFMSKKIIAILVALLLFPLVVTAAPTTDDLQKKIDLLTKELMSVKTQLDEVKKNQNQTTESVQQVSEKVDAVSDKTKSLGNVQWSGDFRFRVDSARADIPAYWDAATMQTAMGSMASFSSQQLQAGLMPLFPSLSPQLQQQMGQMMQQWDSMNSSQRLQVLNSLFPALNEQQRVGMLNSLGYYKNKGYDSSNDLLYTNRLRLNLGAKATENIEFKGRLAMYKIWGMETARATAAPFFANNGFYWDPNITRRPNDNTLRVEMAYVNWTEIGGYPVWFSVGRRPTVDGPPEHLKLNYDKRYATPIGLGVDWTFDGLTLGYSYQNPVPGKVRICYGRGYEAGFDDMPGTSTLNDTDLYGVSWDIIDDKEKDMFANVQLFRAAEIPDVMENENIWGLPETATAQLGDIYHLTGLFMHKYNNVDWFVSGGISHTDVAGDSAALGGVGLLNNPGETENHTGYAIYAGLRVPVASLNSKFGLEYNYGSRYWITFTPASDDLYQAKLSTRGHVAEAYWIWDLPETPISKFGKAFIRAGYQYYWINYTGSGNWLGVPTDVDDLNDPLNAQMFPTVDRMDNAYLTFEVYF